MTGGNGSKNRGSKTSGNGGNSLGRPLRTTPGAAGPAQQKQWHGLILHTFENAHLPPIAAATVPQQLREKREPGETKSIFTKITRCCDAPGLEANFLFLSQAKKVAGTI
jgi:hypothetical protein